MQDDLDNALSVALTSDGWTSRATESAHFIDSDWQMKDYVLQTRPLHDAHTGKNIAEVLTAAVSDWGLSRPTDLKPLVTDNASNVVLAAREGNFTPHTGCFAHTINLASQRALKIAGLARLSGVSFLSSIVARPLLICCKRSMLSRSYRAVSCALT